MSKQMTVKEALESGYKFCGQDKGEWQTLTEIDDVEFEEGDEYLICEKEPTNPYIHPKDLMNLIAEHMQCQWDDETGNDTERVFEAVKELDFEPFAKMINDSVSKIDAYHFTNIKLVP